MLLVAATRLAAAEARDAVTAGLIGATTEPMARTMQSLGFAVLRQQAALLGQPAPRLLSGADQDLVLGELLAGHRESGGGPAWPDDLAEALPTRGFREELRDLLMRAIEHGVSPDDLATLGREHGRPEWVAAAQVAREYDEVTALSRPGAFDPAWVLAAAAELLEDDPEARDRVRSGLRVVVVDDAHELTAPAAGCCACSPAAASTSSSSATPTRRSRASAGPTRTTSSTRGPGATRRPTSSRGATGCPRPCTPRRRG